MLASIVFVIRHIARYFDPVIGIAVICMTTLIIIAAIVATSRPSHPTSSSWRRQLLPKKTSIAKPRGIPHGPSTSALGESTIPIQYATGMRLSTPLLLLLLLPLM